MSLSRSFQSNTDLQYPAVKPVLDLNFTKRTIRGINPAYTFTRNSSGTYVDADGSFKTVGVNQPRFDHDPVTGECKGLLIEEGRTNYFYASNDLDNTFYWFPENTTITLDGTNKRGNYYKIKGTMNGLFIFGTEGGYRGLVSKFSGGHNLNVVPVGSTVTLSMDAKVPDDETGTRNIYFTALATFGQTGGYIDEFFATVSNDSNSGIDLGNGWRRYSNTFPWMTSVNFGGGSAAFVKINPRFSQFQHVLISNLQLEVGTTPTSYIPTTTSGLTRQPEQLVLNNAPISNQGTFFIESNPTVDGTSFVADGVSKLLKINQPTNQYTKSTLYYNTNRILRLSSDSLSFETDSIDFSGLNRISLGFNKSNNSEYINGHIKKFSYYLNSLTDDNLRALTNNKVGSYILKDERIVTNGLILHFDAADPSSYSGSTTWTDLSGNGIDATLNGVGYNSSNGGFLVFDGVNDYAFIGSIPLQLNSYTVSFWVNILSIPGGERQLFAAGSFLTFGMSILSNKFFIWNTNLNYGEQTVETNVWYNWVVTRSGNSTVSRINGIVDGSFQTGISIDSGNQAYIGAIYGNSRFLNAKISNLKIYNRVLAEEEIQQNFNALRGRFGI